MATTNDGRSLYTTDTAEENRRKTRFDPLRPGFIRQQATETDEFGEDVGMSRANAKRKNVRVDGYDSDSSQEGKSKKPKKQKNSSADNDDDDMFNDEPSKDNVENVDNDEHDNNEDDDDEYEDDDDGGGDDEDGCGNIQEKKAKFVDYTTFKGQEVSDDERDIEDEEESVPSTPGGSDDEEVIDEEVGLAGLKKNAPKIEKFNLRQEQAEGVFTDDGGYVRKAADPQAHQDNWLEGLTKGQIRRAMEGREKQRQRELEVEQRDTQEETITSTERLERLIRCLKPKETPLDALARLNQGKKKWLPSQRWKKSKMVVDQQGASVSEDDAGKAKETIETITTHADRLLSAGNMNVYSTTRERLIVLYQREAEKRFRDDPDLIQQPRDVDKWEYKWEGTGDVHSGFSSEDMRSWKAGGYFGDGVLCRRAGSSDTWKNIADIAF